MCPEPHSGLPEAAANVGSSSSGESRGPARATNRIRTMCGCRATSTVRLAPRHMTHARPVPPILNSGTKSLPNTALTHTHKPHSPTRSAQARPYLLYAHSSMQRQAKHACAAARASQAKPVSTSVVAPKRTEAPKRLCACATQLLANLPCPMPCMPCTTVPHTGGALAGNFPPWISAGLVGDVLIRLRLGSD